MPTILTRRSFSPRLLACTLAALAPLLVLAAGGGAHRPVFLIVCDEAPQMEALAATLRARGAAATVVSQERFPADLHGIDGVINYVHRPLTDPVESALIAYAEGGGRLLTLHHGLASAKLENPRWLAFNGIALFRREREKGGWGVLGGVEAQLVNLAPGHPVTTRGVSYDGVTDYTPSDAPSTAQSLPVLKFPRSEVFLNQHFTNGRSHHVLFGVKGKDPETGRVWMQDRGGWCLRTGKGWTFYLQIGHALSDYQKPAYAQIIWNALTWKLPVS